jgi:hypothetical protein
VLKSKISKRKAHPREKPQAANGAAAIIHMSSNCFASLGADASLGLSIIGKHLGPLLAVYNGPLCALGR